MNETGSDEAYTCPRCGAAATRARLAESKYICRSCSLEVAYLDLAPTGAVRNVLGWLQPREALLHDRYRIVGVLGKGGFAATYLVHDTLLKNKARALKEIPSVQYDEEETDLLSRLQHPAIPDIMDRFELGAMTYLVLEFGGDRTLEMERRTEGGTILLDKLLPWMSQLCEVLAYLHGQQPPIVHRDLKPDNILLDERDHIMLIDFGIAKESGGFAETRILARSASYGFSPPEQMMSTGTDQRSDVYSLGATMYALLTGKVPIPANERVAGTELKAPSTLNPAVPAGLDTAIMQALELNVNRRPQSISEFRKMLDPGAWAPVNGEPAFEGATRTVRVDSRTAITPGSSTRPIDERTDRGRRPAVAIAVGGTVAVLFGIGLWWSGVLGGHGSSVTDDRNKAAVVVPEPAPPPPQSDVANNVDEVRKAMEDAQRQQVVEAPHVVEEPTPSEPHERAAKPDDHRTRRTPRAGAAEPTWDIIYGGTKRTE